MPSCQNCGAHVTWAYIRVRSPNQEHVEVCPKCPDRVRRKGRPVRSRSSKIFAEDGNEGGDWSWD